MNRCQRLALLLVPIVLGAISAALPGRAQTPSSSRFAFADTTLLRDTLGISFTDLFELADSLRLTPDTLRALSVRYRFPPVRMVHLADSLGIPVDSVGVVLERERFNPLARTGDENVTAMLYTTNYNVQQTQSSWGNNLDFNLERGPLFLRNLTLISIDRYSSGAIDTRRKTRNANTEAGWRLNQDMSLGARAIVEVFDSDDPSSGVITDKSNDFQFSGRSRQAPTRNLSTELNMFAGILDQTGSQVEKFGMTGEANARMLYRRGAWFSNELRGTFSGNAARTRLPGAPEHQRTHDYNQLATANLQLYPNSPVGLIANAKYRDGRVETPSAVPQDSGRTRLALSSGLDGSLDIRMRRTADRYLNLTSNFGTTDAGSASYTGQTERFNRVLGTDGRYDLLGWVLEGRFSNGFNRTESPRVTVDGGYIEEVENRNLDGKLNRRLTPKLNLQLNGGISLALYRYTVVDSYPSPPVSRDNYRQSYRVDVLYNYSTRFNTGAGLEVARTQLVNIAATSTSANNITRTYRADWRWTYRLTTGLTATQRNTLSANYLAYTFREGQDRLNLEYGNVTTLNAVLSPRLVLNLTHSSSLAPSGSYLQDDVDGEWFFSPSDRSQVFELRSDLSYTPTPGFSLTLAPLYRSVEREGTVNGVTAPQRQDRTLTVDGGAVVSLPVAQRGRLEGNFGRRFQGQRTATYTAGVAEIAPVTEQDFWRGALTFSWQL